MSAQDRLFCITFFPCHIRTILTARSLLHASQPSSCCISLPIYDKRIPEYLLCGPQAHLHLPSAPLLIQAPKLYSQLHNKASKSLTQSEDSIKNYGKGIHVQECLSVRLTFRLKQVKLYLSLSAFLTWKVLKCNFSTKVCSDNTFLFAWLHFQEV